MPSNEKLLIGPRIARFRKTLGLTQSRMAEDLGISTSYLNLMERNQRSLSAKVLLRMAEIYDFDIASFTGAGDAHLVAEVKNDENVELLEQSSQAVDSVRRFLHKQKNYFPALDAAAEKLAKELGYNRAQTGTTLTKRLQEKHGISVRVVPVDIMPQMLRYFDRHSKRINLSELLPQSGRRFQLAYQISILEYRDLIDEVVDVDLLCHRFGTSFEQTAHRLTTLQKPDARGIPFFFVRIDVAGNVSKRFSAGRFHFSRFGGACPIWNIHECFLTPDKTVTQIIQMPDDTTYFSIAKMVVRSNGTYKNPLQKLAIGLGCDIAYAPRLVYAEKYNLNNPRPSKIGVNCHLCERPHCRQRAHAPLNRIISFDERRRGISLYDFDET